ncbi:MAG: 30S ribosomal protein S12 methylthiotransferase RimO [Clostridia bacterium]|nr:30S ribosomal protein S12 methylthiotransferase RimO [Clostridia bacterium]
MDEANTKIYLLSLGCAKNLVNSELMLGRLRAAGMEICDSPEGADAAIVNTCGFIDSAKSEAIEAILELAELKKQGLIRALIVTGCLTQRYQSEFLTELPEVDAALGTGSYDRIVEAVRGALAGKEHGTYFDPREHSLLMGERVLLTPGYSAYLRIAEGCDNCCSFCVIPKIRGRFRSVPMEELEAEARRLAAAGTRELLVVAQDITRYGLDLYGKCSLAELLRRLERIEGLRWIRLHYLYPDEMDDELLEVIAASRKILHYFDIPIQHVNDRILKAMNRRGSGALIRERIARLRALVPDAVIRTSLIVGFPGETEAEYRELYGFLEEYRLERVGVFCYSQEEGTAAAVMPDQIPEEIKERRRAEIYALQEQIMDAFSRKQIGRTLEVLCCGRDEEGCFGRSYMDSVEIDGTVYFESEHAREGDFVTVRVDYAEGCDLYGRALSEV